MLIERRAFSVQTGHIQDAAELVVAVERTEPALLIFNDLVIDVAVEDTAAQIVDRWNAKRIASIG